MRESINKYISRYSASSLVRGFVATLMGSGASRILLFFTTFVVVKMLSADDFGQFSFIRNTLEMILSICAVNFASLCTKFTTEAAHNDRSLQKLINLFIFCFCICGILGACLIVLPENLLLRIFLNQQIVNIFRIIGIILPILFLGPLFQGVYTGWQKFKFVGIVQTISAVFFFVSASLGTWLYGIGGALCAVVVYYIFYSAIISIDLFRRIDFRKVKVRIVGFANERKVILTEVLPMFAMSFVEAPALWISQLMLSRIGGFGAVGAMAIIMQIRNIIMIIPGYFFGTFVSFACKMNAEGDYKSYFGKFDFIIKKLLLLSAIAVFVLTISGYWLLGLFNKEYTADYIPYLLGIMALPLILITALIKMHFVIRERQRSLLCLSVSWNILWIILFCMLYKLNVQPLIAFFGGQDIAFSIYSLFLIIIYLRDKKNLSYAKN